jgi:hypothetical protein
VHKNHEAFLDGLQTLQRVTLQFRSKEDGDSTLTRSCAPMDYGPSRKAQEKTERYHFWDYDSDKQRHTLSLPSEQIISITLDNQKFTPSEFITWDVKCSPWFTPRDWGAYS